MERQGYPKEFDEEEQILTRHRLQISIGISSVFLHLR